MIFFYNEWSILNAPSHVEFKAPIDKCGRGMFFGPGKEPGNEGQRIIFCLVNRLSLQLETKREVNRAINEIRFFLKKRVKQRQNGQRMRVEKEVKKKEGNGEG